MIFPDKPRPPWQYPQPQISKKIVEISEAVKKLPKPKGYYRERIEFALIFIGLYFWINFWLNMR